MIEQPTICLNMIVRNEAHIVGEALDAVAPHIAYWVIVDTGSDDGTQDAIRTHMAALGIPGELHERPWIDFGHNRSEALALAQGRADYVWVIDADDTVIGTPNFGRLDADVYLMRIGDDALRYWRRQLFRDGMPWRYVGVVHEYADCTEPHVESRLDGDYYVASRRLGARSQDPQKYARDRDLLLAEAERAPDDARTAFYLAQSYADLGDDANALAWYARRADMPGWDEETYVAKFRVAEAMARLDNPWPDVLDAYLRAWEFRPTRAEPLHAIARWYRTEQRYQLGHPFAERAARIPLPADDTLFVATDVYAWRALDEQAVCASWIGDHAGAVDICRRLLAMPELPDDDRVRIAANRDVSVPATLERACEATPRVRLTPGGDVTVSVTAGSDRALAERTLNSFLNCCTDVERVARIVVAAQGMSAEDRVLLLERYRDVEFIAVEEPGELDGRFWLRLGAGCGFFAPEALLTRLTSVLAAEPTVGVVGINLDDAVALTGRCAEERVVRRGAGTGRYLLADAAPTGPALIDLHRRDGGAATLDEVLCVALA